MKLRKVLVFNLTLSKGFVWNKGKRVKMYRIRIIYRWENFVLDILSRLREFKSAECSIPSLMSLSLHRFSC